MTRTRWILVGAIVVVWESPCISSSSVPRIVTEQRRGHR